MGLDMDLVRRNKPQTNLKTEDLEEQDIIYWRKANHIHNWFVMNLIDHVDNCKASKITTNELLDLITVLEYIEKNPDDMEYIESELPTADGFFFGSTDYDHYYFESIKDAIPKLKDLFNTTNFEEQEIFYFPSW